MNNISVAGVADFSSFQVAAAAGRMRHSRGILVWARRSASVFAQQWRTDRLLRNFLKRWLTINSIFLLVARLSA